MRTPPRSKPFHRKLLICTALASIFVIPTAFAHGHHGGSANSNARHGGYAHHRLGSSGSRADRRDDIASQGDRATAALDPSSRRHQHIPDEEEIEQAEQ